MKKIIFLIFCVIGLTSCDLFNPYGNSNIPVPAKVTINKPEFVSKILWQHSAGKGSDNAYLLLAPALNAAVIYTVDQEGLIKATNVVDGKTQWKISLVNGGKSSLSSEDNILAVVDAKAILYVLNSSNGKIIWKTQVSNQVLAAPTIAAHLIMTKTIDGTVSAFDRATGKLIWTYQHNVPNLMLRASSAVNVLNDVAYVGFSDGSVVALNVNNGVELWTQQVAEPEGFAAIQRLVDIDARLIVTPQRIYVATYQGNVAALDRATGKIIWQQKNSVYTDIINNKNILYAITADGTFSAYQQETGKIVWQKKQLAWHFLSGASLYDEQFLIVGDIEGNIYFISSKDGSIVSAKVISKKSMILASPLIYQNIILVIDAQGNLTALTANI